MKGTTVPLFPLPSHLCSLILVESLDLESILAHLEDPGYAGMGIGPLHNLSLHFSRCLEDHHLLKSDSSSEVEVWKTGVVKLY